MKTNDILGYGGTLLLIGAIVQGYFSVWMSEMIVPTKLFLSSVMSFILGLFLVALASESEDATHK